MNFVLKPWQLLFVILAGWVNRQQQEVIDYLRTENQILKEKIGKRRILLNDDQRRRLAVKGKVLGRKLLGQIGTLVTPDTILRWHHLLVAKKWDYSDRRKKSPGRPALRVRLLKPAKQRNYLENPWKNQSLVSLFSPGSCKLPGRGFRDSLKRLPEKTIKLPTRQYTAGLYTGGLDICDPKAPRW